ncbi:MAG: M12 family metallo-peptidase [Phycisphaerae bacterium]
MVCIWSKRLGRFGCAAVCLWMVVGSQAPARAGEDRSLHRRANEALKLQRSELVQVSIDRRPEVAQTVALPIGGRRLVLDLWPHSVRADGYAVLAPGADGALWSVAPEPVRTLRGTVREDGGTVVGSVTAAGLTARVRLSEGRVFWIEPLAGRVPGATPADHVVFADTDAVADGPTLAGELGVDGGGIVPPHPRGGSMGTTCVAELGVDADVEFFQRWGLAGAQDRINLFINTINLQYEQEVGITHAISVLVIRTVEPDPYSQTDCALLLDELRQTWLMQPPGPFDLAFLFTGKVLDAPLALGCFSATQGAICTPDAFLVVQSEGLPFLCGTDLIAHELGHLWGAMHCTTQVSSTMNTPLQCANTFLGCTPDSTALITAFRDQVPCLDCACAAPADGDMDGDGLVNGSDVRGFVDAVVGGPGLPGLVCHGDFNGDGAVSLPDLPAMVMVLLAP